MSKYGAKKVEADGYTFDSKLEAKRYGELSLLLRAGVIRDLVVHPGYPLYVGDTKIGMYEADFSYFDLEQHAEVVEDCKGMRLPMYRWKVKHLKAQHGIDVVEILS